MKKMLVVALLVVVGLALVTSVYAYRGPGYGCGPGQGKEVDISAFKNFQKETGSLRDEMAVKRMEIRNEFAKENPDESRIAALQKEMIDLRTKIQASAERNGLPALGKGRGMKGGFGAYGGPGRGHGMMGRGGQGPCFGQDGQTN